MINAITALLKGGAEASQNHQWVMFCNPRNGAVQISACKNCGTIYTPALASRICKTFSGKTLMEDKGWIIVNDSDTSNKVAA